MNRINPSIFLIVAGTSYQLYMAIDFLLCPVFPFANLRCILTRFKAFAALRFQEANK